MGMWDATVRGDSAKYSKAMNEFSRNEVGKFWTLAKNDFAAATNFLYQKSTLIQTIYGKVASLASNMAKDVKKLYDSGELAQFATPKLLKLVLEPSLEVLKRIVETILEVSELIMKIE